MDNRTTVRRQPHRAVSDSEDLLALIDGLPIASVSYCHEGLPYVYPTLVWRSEDFLYWHGSSASHSLRRIAGGAELCVNLLALDGVVLARSGMNSSVNYRSVTLFGVAEALTDPQQKVSALEHFCDHLIPGRWPDVRPVKDAELKATTVVRLPIEEVSGKVRSGPSNDDEADYALDIWAGVVPVSTELGEPVPYPRLAEGVPQPQYLAKLRLDTNA